MEIFKPIAQQFKPDVILVSSGYDSHYADNLGGLHLGIDYYGNMIKQFQKIQSKIVITIEGGYNLEVIGDCFLSQVSMLCNKPMIFDDRIPISINQSDVIDKLKKNLKQPLLKSGEGEWVSQKEIKRVPRKDHPVKSGHSRKF